MKKTVTIVLAVLLALLPFCDVYTITGLNLWADSSEASQGGSGGFLAFPDNMKTSVITIGKDFFTDPTQSAETTQSEIDGIFSDFDSFGFNTVIIDTTYNGQSYYEIDEQIFTHGSPLSMILDSAVERHYFIYITFEINQALRSNDYTDFGDKIDYLTYCIHRITSKYLIDGIILSDYYNERGDESYRLYKEYGSGIGYENWLLENGSFLFGRVSDAIRATNNSVAVGIDIDNVWQNQSSDPEGSSTQDDFEALNDGFSDTKKYILDGLADFAVVYCYGGLESTSLSFKEVVSWWNGICSEAEIPMFIKHANSRVSSSDRSWAVDQIVKQIIECENYSKYRGSIFESYGQLKENSVSTDAIIKYYEGKIDVSGLYSNLKMVLPTKQEFVTYEPTQIFQGTFDPNFDVYYNGEALKLNEAGNFYFIEDLDVGLNTFTFKNKADTVTYRITRKIQVLRSVEPAAGNVMYVEGKTRIAVNVIAYKGSSVAASLNGETIMLKEDDSQSDDLDSNTNYVHFTGYFEAPEGIVGEEQDLGNIFVSGTYNEYNKESQTAAKVIVNAIPLQAEAAKLVKIKDDNTITYDYYTTDNIATPDCPRLPAGTLDVYVNTVTYNTKADGVQQSYEYYLTQSGLRIRSDACELIDGYTFFNNTAEFAGSYVSGIDTVLRINMTHQTPFTVSFSPLSFENASNGNFKVSSFNPEYVIITFDYVEHTAGMPSFTGDSMFTSGEWSMITEDGEPKAQLKLKLRRPGVFMGYKSSYDGSGGLTITFNGCNTSLVGTTIIVDPGHGYNLSASVFDPGAVGHVTEQKMNLAIAKQLYQQLKDAGATVYILPTDTQFISVYYRSTYARQYDPDIYIAIHCNALENGEGVRGTEAHYFTPWSQPLAAAISQRMATYYENNVYGDGKNRNRGAYYNYFAVTLQQEFSSVLVESGFVTDYTEAMALNDPTNQAGLASAIVQGIRDYLSR